MLILLIPLQLMVKHGETGVSPTIDSAFSLDSIPLQAASIGAIGATPATPRSPSGAVKPAPAAAAMAAEAAAMAEKWDLDGSCAGDSTWNWVMSITSHQYNSSITS